MKKKLMIASVSGLLALGGLAAISGAIGSGKLSLTKAGTAHADHSHDKMVEMAFRSPTTTSEGYKPYYRCDECCASDANSSRYSLTDKDESVSDVVIPALTAAAAEDVASGDGISTVNTKKFKYVDQGANGVSGTSDGVESTPVYVKDSGKTAIYFSASGKTGEATNPTSNDGCAEFRFSVPSEASKSKSATFSYKYRNWGTGGWAGSASASEPAGWTALCQFKDNGYIGHDISSKLINDGEWHTLKLDYSGGTTSNLTDFILKFADLRGYMMVSGLSYEATADVTLKNASADGTDKTENVSVGSLPEAPTMDGKKFLGWYDESGNKVESVTASTATLVARWTTSYYDDSNAKVLTFRNVQSDYTNPDGVDAAYAVRSDAEREIDIETKKTYPETPEGSQGFNPGSDSNASLGLGLPAFDFSKVSGVRFTFGFHAGVWSGVSLNGNDLGNDACDQPGYTEYKWKNFEVTVVGKSVSVYSNYTKATTVFELDEDTYAGRKGLEIRTAKSHGAWLFLAPFVTFDCDYLSLASSIEAALPDTPASGYADQVKKYGDLRSFMTEYEKEANPVSEKMQAWIDAYTATKALAFDDHGDSVYAGLTGNSSFNASTYVSKYENNDYKDESRTDSLQFKLLGLDCTYFTLTLPKFDFSSHGKTSFKMEVGGGPGDKTFDYWLGAIPDTPATPTAAPTADLLGASNYIGVAPTGTQDNWDTGGTTVTISSGKITFSGLSSKADDQTFDLDESVNNGTAGLAITIGWGSWNCLAISPFYASQF